MISDMPDVPVRLTCSRCYEERAVSVVWHTGIDGYPEFTLDPPCPGYYDPEEPEDTDDTFYASMEPVPLTKDTDTVQRVWCPFDGQDDYSHTGDEDKVFVAQRYARDVLAAVEGSSR